MTTTLGFEVTLPLPFDAAVTCTRDALKTEGFGILTEIDLQAAFKEKLGKDFRPYLILGACNPTLAFTALAADPAIGLLLPCNVTVEAAPSAGCTVRLTDPPVLLGTAGGIGSAALREVATDAHARMERVVRRLRDVAAPPA